MELVKELGVEIMSYLELKEAYDLQSDMED
jgi:hypothetical protein